MNMMQKEETEEPGGCRTSKFFEGRILLVDDNNMTREITAELLVMYGFVVEEAVNGVEAVNCFESHEENYYSAILMDLRMPVMDGYEATRHIRRSPRRDAAQIPIIAITTNTFLRDGRKAMEAGMDYFVEKPVDMKRLCRFLKYSVRKRKGLS